MQFIDIIYKMLEKNAANRPSTIDILAHPIIKAQCELIVKKKVYGDSIAEEIQK